MDQFLETFPNVIQYKNDKENMVADALSRNHVLINILSSEVPNFECLKELYFKDPIFLKSSKIVRNSKGKYGLEIDLLLHILNLMVSS